MFTSETSRTRRCFRGWKEGASIENW